jgi:Ankyrin repeats (many copies)
VATVPLPDRASFEQLRNQAKDLRRAVRAGAPDALAEAADRYPGALTGQGPFPLSAAQLVVARRYGFASWARLKRHCAVIERYTRFPPTGPDDPAGAAPRAAEEGGDLADTFLRLACLWYEDDQPARWAAARELLTAHPELTRGHVHAAAAAADGPALASILASDPSAARRESGPYQAEPLYYLAYARHDPAIAEDAVLGVARMLLAAGADPNAGYLWRGLPSPFTVLTGVFGEGELGPVRQPRHPCAQPLARLLLTAGADANDAQALYNRMFEPGNDHLELLFEFGLGQDTGGPWLGRLGEALGSPASTLRGQLAWAITHGMTDRVRLLAEQGVDVAAPFEDGDTPAAVARTTGHADLVSLLVSYGAAEPSLPPLDDFIAAALAADQARIGQLQDSHPDLVATARAARPALVVWAAVLGRADVIRLLVGLGFDINAKGRTDGVGTSEWETALHHAAGKGDLDLVRELIALGADPDIRDTRFGGTPLGWARYFGQEQTVRFLAPLTMDGPAG